MQLSNGNYTFTDANGYYQIQTDSIGAYTLTITPPTGYNALPATVLYNFTTWDTVVTKDIALQPTTSFDSINVYCLPILFSAVQGNPMPYWVGYENSGTTVLSPNVVLGYNNYLLLYDSCTDVNAVPFASGVATTTNNMQPGQANSFVGFFDVKITAPVGDTLTTTYSATTTTVAVADSFKMIIESNATPPVANAQRATPSLTQTEVSSGKEIIYTIYYKNTGADTAFNIIIIDTLSPSLQANTLKMIAGSHTCRTTVKGNIVTFELLNIKLPKASINNLKSAGFINFKIKPKTTLTAGTIITNKTNTYYNYRIPVSSIATTVVKAVVTPLSIIDYQLLMINEKQVKNIWTTANEINVSHFNIQRSVNGKNFITIGKIGAKNKAENRYSFTDDKLTIINDKLTLYYRLQSIDKDGKITYSEIKKIIINDKQETRNVVVFPNPATNEINISRKTANTALVIITDITGRIVKKTMINSQYTKINMESLQKGIYILSFENGEKAKLVKE